MFPHLSSSIKALLKYANDARREEHRAVKWGVADAPCTPVTGRCYLLSRFSVGRRALLTRHCAGHEVGAVPLSRNEGCNGEVCPLDWKASFLVKGWLLLFSDALSSPYMKHVGSICQIGSLHVCRFQNVTSHFVPNPLTCHHQFASLCFFPVVKWANTFLRREVTTYQVLITYITYIIGHTAKLFYIL